MVIRRHETWLDSNRSTSSTALGISAGIGDELVPLVAPRQQAEQALPISDGDRLVAGERQAVDDRLDLAVRELVGVGVVGGEQLGREVIVARVDVRRR